MQLFYANASPYARKVRLVAHEKGLQDRIELHHCMPLENPPELLHATPLGKVPTLVLDDGTALYDSPVICEYLDSLNDTPRLLPASGAARWMVLLAQALADGLLDTAVAQIYESRRPEHERSPNVVTRWHNQMLRALAEMEVKLPQLPEALTLGHLAFAAALGYLDLRFNEINWRASHPALGSWFDQFAERASMQATKPA